MSGRTAVAIGLVAALALAACSTDDGRALQPPPPGATAPPRTVEGQEHDGAAIAPSDAAFLVTSEAFVEGGVMPDQHTCFGEDSSPPLSWTGFPPGPVEFAIMVTDPDAGEFVHWTAWGIPGDVTAIGAGSLPDGAVEGTNGFGEIGWSGPCPPPGPAHRYVIQVHAMEAPLPLEEGASVEAFRSALASFAHGTLTATFTAPQ